MRTILHNCCGLDVHKDSVVACILKTSNLSEVSHDIEEVDREIRVFETFPNTLNELKIWLESENCHHVAMESTGVYWHPVYDALEGAFKGDIEILVVNARHMRNVPGKKTDVKDAEWIASLLRAGLLRGSFVPSLEQREFRQLVRYRKNIVADIGTQKNRIEKALQTAGFKLSTFLTDIFGVSGRNIIIFLLPKDIYPLMMWRLQLSAFQRKKKLKSNVQSQVSLLLIIKALSKCNSLCWMIY